MKSASRTADMRCATMKQVRPARAVRSSLRIASSVAASTLESASSRIRIEGSSASARASAILCR